MGQICTATSRIYVQQSVYDKFLDEFVHYTKKTSVIGSQFDPNVNHGPQVSRAQYEKILQYAESAKSAGANLVLGGTGRSGSEKGYFIRPTIFSNVTSDMAVVKEEVFGPFVIVKAFATEDEAVKEANNTEYGLGAAIFTKDITRALKTADLVEAGTVWVSNFTHLSVQRTKSCVLQINSSQDSHFGIPFGGYKQSGIGRELGAYALSAYTQVKAVHGESTLHVLRVVLLTFVVNLGTAL